MRMIDNDKLIKDQEEAKSWSYHSKVNSSCEYIHTSGTLMYI